MEKREGSAFALLSLLAPSTYEAQTSFWESRPRSLYLNRMPARPECTDFSAFPVCSDITLNVQDESGSSVTEVCPGKNYKVKVRVSSKNYKVKVRVSSVTEVCPGKNYRVKVWVSSKNYKVKVRVSSVTEACPGKNYRVKVRVSSKNYKVKVRVSSVTEVCPGKNYRVKVRARTTRSRYGSAVSQRSVRDRKSVV